MALVLDYRFFSLFRDGMGSFTPLGTTSIVERECGVWSIFIGECGGMSSRNRLRNGYEVPSTGNGSAMPQRSIVTEDD